MSEMILAIAMFCTISTGDSLINALSVNRMKHGCIHGYMMCVDSATKGELPSNNSRTRKAMWICAKQISRGLK